MAPYASGSQIVRVTAAVVHGCDPLLPRQGRPGEATLCIASVPPKSVNRTNFYEDVTISASKGLVNLVAAEPLGRQLFGAVSESKHADCDQAQPLNPRDYLALAPPAEATRARRPRRSEWACFCRDPAHPSSAAE